MLTAVEQQLADDQLPRDAEPLRCAPRPRKSPFVFTALWWVSVLTMTVGAVRPGLGMAFAVGFSWLLWRYLPVLGNALEAVSAVDDERDRRNEGREPEGEERS